MARIRDHNQMISSKEDAGYTPLHWAAERGHKGAMKLLLIVMDLFYSL
jgi:ankyrin repeat protein